MRKIILLFLCVGLFKPPLIAQQSKELDSLFSLLDDSKMNQQQMLVNRGIALKYRDINVSKALDYFEKSKQLAVKLNDDGTLADNLSNIGYCYYGKADYKKAIDYFLQAVRKYEAIKNFQDLATTYLSIISVYRDMHEMSKARDYARMAEKLIAQTKDSSQMVFVYSQWGGIYSQEGKQDSAVHFMLKELAIARSLKNKSYENISLGNIGLAYYDWGKFDLALRYIDSSVLLAHELNNDMVNLASTHNNRACLYVKLKDYNKALQDFKVSIMYCEKSGYNHALMENYRNLSDMYYETKDFPNHSFYLKKYYQLRDSLNNNESRSQIQQLETDYVLGKKDLELVKKDASIKQQRNQRNIFIILALAAFSILGAALFFYKKIKTKNSKLEHQQELILSQKNELENLNHVKDRLFGVISHDLRNPLNTLQTYLMLSDNETMDADKRLLFKDQTVQAVAQTSNLLDNLLTWANMQIRETTPEKTPYPILDLVEDVTSVIKPQAQRKEVQIVLHVQQAKVITDYNILSIALRNILTNAIKFSRVQQEVIIQGVAEGAMYKLQIIDYGSGMREDQIQAILNYSSIQSLSGTQGESGTGLGLFLVKQLLDKAEISLSIESEVGKGSTFTMMLDVHGRQ
ncbi:MAG: tetratricopeptide repeat-containing sensor histidine kinase [Chitinophagaceae bacterium]|nr:tetratricopeptide repeat-containing sensor histidine kinase [Chitinophagaceae bacterium]